MEGRIYNHDTRGWCVRYHDSEINKTNYNMWKTHEIPLLKSQIITAEKNFGTGKFDTKIEFELFYDCIEDKNYARVIF